MLFTLLLWAFLSLNTWYSSLGGGNSLSPLTGYFSANSQVSVPCYFTFADLGTLLTLLPGCGSQQGHSTLLLMRQRAEYKTCAAPAPCYTSHTSCLPTAQQSLQCSSYLIKTYDQRIVCYQLRILKMLPEPFSCPTIQLTWSSAASIIYFLELNPVLCDQP